MKNINWKRTMLSIIACLALVFALLPAAQAEETGVASVTIGETVTYYTAFGDAISAASSATAADKAVVTLLTDIDLGDSTQDITGGVFTLDLNGFKLSSTSSSSFLSLTNSANLTVTDSGNGGAIQAEKSVIRARDTSVVTINSGTIHSNSSDAIWFQSTKSLTVNGGTITTNGETSGITTSKTGTVTINGGIISSAGYYVIKNGGAGKLIIKGGSISGKYGVLMSDGSLTITGGTISVENTDIGFFSGCDGIVITGGTFSDGLTISGSQFTLSTMLGSGYAYWQGSTMIIPASDAKEITGGDVTVKEECKHNSGTKNYTNNGDDHSFIYSCCNITVKENHSYTDCVCICGATCPHENYENGICTACGATCDHSAGTLGTPVPTANGTQHIATYDCCGATVTENHTHDIDTGICTGCDAQAAFSVTDSEGVTTYYLDTNGDELTPVDEIVEVFWTVYDDCTVTLYSDVSGGQLAIATGCTLELNGHTITVSSNVCVFSASVTIRNGTIVSTGGEDGAIQVSGGELLQLENLTVTNETGYGVWVATDLEIGSNCTINGEQADLYIVNAEEEYGNISELTGTPPRGRDLQRVYGNT